MDEQLILTVERLLTDLGELAKELRARFASASRPVRGGPVPEWAARLAETWMVEVASAPEVREAVGADYMADVTVHFQRLLSATERASSRATYERELRAILRDARLKLVIPLKQMRQAEVRPAVAEVPPFTPTCFVGMSFADDDEEVNRPILDLLGSLGLRVETGERPKAGRISDKVKQRIEEQHLFVGVFTRRDKLVGKDEWGTSAWIIDEKAYANARGKPLILLREEGVQSIGGIHGDYEYIVFSRDALPILFLRLVQLFDLRVDGLAP